MSHIFNTPITFTLRRLNHRVHGVTFLNDHSRYVV